MSELGHNPNQQPAMRSVEFYEPEPGRSSYEQQDPTPPDVPATETPHQIIARTDRQTTWMRSNSAGRKYETVQPNEKYL